MSGSGAEDLAPDDRVERELHPVPPVHPLHQVQQVPPVQPRGVPARASRPRRPSGRQRHDEKITVYVSSAELLELEHARLVLRREHGLAVDRGRIVREAVAVVLADLAAAGDASVLVRRLAES